MCLKTGPDGIPKCDGMCEKTSHCAGDEFCIDSMPEFQNPNKVLSGVCMAKCDPFNVAADSDPGQECDAIPAVEGTLIPACLQAMGASPEGTPCASFPFQCSPGLTCSKASWESDVHCRAFCTRLTLARVGGRAPRAPGATSWCACPQLPTAALTRAQTPQATPARTLRRTPRWTDRLGPSGWRAQSRPIRRRGDARTLARRVSTCPAPARTLRRLQSCSYAPSSDEPP